jgi:hypothetical protein
VSYAGHADITPHPNILMKKQEDKAVTTWKARAEVASHPSFLIHVRVVDGRVEMVLEVRRVIDDFWFP